MGCGASTQQTEIVSSPDPADIREGTVGSIKQRERFLVVTHGGERSTIRRANEAELTSLLQAGATSHELSEQDRSSRLSPTMMSHAELSEQDRSKSLLSHGHIRGRSTDAPSHELTQAARLGPAVDALPDAITVFAASGESLRVGSRIIVANTNVRLIHGQPGTVYQLLSGEDAGRVMVELASGEKLNIKGFNLYVDDCGCGLNHHTPDAVPPESGWHIHKFEDGTVYSGDFMDHKRYVVSQLSSPAPAPHPPRLHPLPILLDCTCSSSSSHIRLTKYVVI